MLSTCAPSTVIVQPLNPNVATEGWSYFHVKCPCLHLCETALSLSAFICQTGLQCPLQPIKVKNYAVILWVITLCCLVGTNVLKERVTSMFCVFKQNVPQKHWYPCTRLYGVITLKTTKTTIWIFATLKTSTCMLLWLLNN
jgi:hypothetical protein